MNQDIHDRAEKLIAQARVEGISRAESEWLEAHLADCERCAERAAAAGRAIEALRLVSIPIDPAVVKAARLRVQLRALELGDERNRMRGLWLSCALSWVLGVATAPLVWRGFEWAGQRLGTPDLVWQAGFVFWWALTIAAAAAILVTQKSSAPTYGDDSARHG